MSGLFKGLSLLTEFIYKKILAFKDILKAIYESDYFFFIGLVLIGLVIYYVLEILIGIKLGSEYREFFTNKKQYQDKKMIRDDKDINMIRDDKDDKTITN